MNPDRASRRGLQSRYAKVFHANPVATVIATLDDGRILDFNDAWVRLTGYSREELIGKTSLEVGLWARPEGRARVMALLREKGSVRGLESELRRKSGELRAVSSYGEQIVIDGELCVVGMLEDITERKRSEEVLTQSEERLRSVIEALDEGVVFLDTSGTIRTLNSAAIRILGLTADQAVGLTAFHPSWNAIDDRGNLLPPERYPGQQTLRTGQPVKNAVLRVDRPDGKQVWISASTQPLFRPGEGRPHAAVESFTDITSQRQAEDERKWLEERRREAVEEWSLTFDAVEFPIVVLDGEGRIRRLNRAAHELSGFDKDVELLGRPFGALGGGEPWRAAGRLVEALRNEGAREELSERAHDPATSRIWDVSATLISPGLSESRAVVTARDITRLAELQNSLQRSETLAALGTLVAGVVHELRNPLFAISGTIEAWKERFEGDEAQRRFWEVLKGESDRLGRLMQSLLDYARPVSSERRRGLLREIVAAVVFERGPLALSRRVDVRTDVSEEAVWIELDESSLVRAFEIVLDNALQLSPESSVVEVRISPRTFGAATWVECSVRDRGPGFSNGDLSRVFEPFYTHRPGGTGLGLAIARRIVEAHGGVISAANAPDGGAEVTLRLPMAAS